MGDRAERGAAWRPARYDDPGRHAGDVTDQALEAQIDLARQLLGSGTPVTIGCTQEAPLFTEIAEELGAGDRVDWA